jgi:hypothetical protein
MTRFLILVTFCLVAIGSVGYLLASAVRQSGEVHSQTYRPRPGDILAPVGPEAEPPDPGQNLEDKLRSLIDDRDRRVSEARLDVGRVATEVVQLVSQLRIVRADFDAKMAAYRAMRDMDNANAGLIAAWGGHTPDRQIPMFPFAEIQGLEARFHAAESQFAIAKNSSENKIQMIQNEFLRQFIDIVGKRRASEAPPVPVTAADAPIQQATDCIANFDDFMTKVYSGWLFYKRR